MAEEPRGFNPAWDDPREPGTDPVPVGGQEPTPAYGVPLDSLPPPIKGDDGLKVDYDGYAYIVRMDLSEAVTIDPSLPNLWTAVWREDDNRFYRVDFSTLHARIADLHIEIGVAVQAGINQITATVMAQQSAFEASITEQQDDFEAAEIAARNAFQASEVQQRQTFEIAQTDRQDTFETDELAARASFEQGVNTALSTQDAQITTLQTAWTSYQGLVNARLDDFEADVTADVAGVIARVDAVEIAVAQALELAGQAAEGVIADDAVTRAKLAPAVRDELDGKSPVGHTHPASDITGLDAAITTKGDLAGNNTWTGNNSFEDALLVQGSYVWHGGNFTPDSYWAKTDRILTPASVAAGAGLRVPEGTAPSVPVDGDIWLTSSGMMLRRGGSTRTQYDSGNLTVVTQTDAEAGTSSTSRLWTAERVKQATLAHAYSKAAVDTALGLKAPIASPTFTGTATVRTSGTLGYVSLISSDSATLTGLIGWYTGTGARKGYMGYNAAATPLTYNSDDGTGFATAGGPFISENGVVRARNYAGGAARGVYYFGNTDSYLYYDGTNFALQAQAGSPVVTRTWMFYNANGDFVSPGNVGAYSDSRLKTDLVQIKDAMAKIRQLTGYDYTRTDSGERQTGLIAQDVQRVKPEAVRKNQDGILSLAYGNLMGLVVEALKDLEDRIIALEHVHAN